MFELLRDGERVLVGTEIECWDYILDNHSFSVHWACENEGYEIRPLARTPQTAEKSNGTDTGREE